ncbi:helix-turn-helix domain-containing protein [Leucobacter massiliensis]|uniref:HTH araC/xylS-type domain-containing protein n=1 Tax=Leucobacter massiliensis TaxID=1686285 RepID=A0A2S9QLH6_9MICO|nr:hypothetical protein B4915_11695 [Leucobacter massiliensis]
MDSVSADLSASSIVRGCVASPLPNNEGDGLGPMRVLRAHASRKAGPTQSEDVKLVYTVRGSTEIVFDNGSISLRRGGMAVLPPRRQYTCVPSTAVETVTLYVDQQFALEQVQWLPYSGKLLGDLFAGSQPRLLTFAPRHGIEIREHLGTLAHLGTLVAKNDLDRMAHLARVLSLVLGDGETMKDPVHVHPQVGKAIALLEDHLDQHWTVSLLAERVSLSPAHLTRLFVRHTGLPPSKFLREARAYRMHEILTQEDRGVAAAARAVGWIDLSQASRSYRTVFGHPPSSSTRVTL